MGACRYGYPLQRLVYSSVELWRTVEVQVMVTIWGWCLVFVIAGQQPIVQFDYKTEADCDASRITVNAQHAEAATQSWCVPIPKPEKTVKAKSKKRRTAKRR
jgi:hypothetical protein